MSRYGDLIIVYYEIIVSFIKLFNFMSVTSSEKERERYNKKMADFISRFDYYSQAVVESADLDKGPRTV